MIIILKTIIESNLKQQYKLADVKLDAAGKTAIIIENRWAKAKSPVQVTLQASLFETVTNMKLKEDELLGNNGINLSGGQKQRISIARELYKDVEILILDEATSALDTETEKRIQENIEALKGKYTIIVIAHRISTIKNVDRVVLLDKGKIIETGTFSQIIKKHPQYSY